MLQWCCCILVLLGFVCVRLYVCLDAHACVQMCLYFYFFHFMFNVSRRKCNLNGSLKNHLQHYTWAEDCARAHSFIGGWPALYFSYYVYEAVHSLNRNYCCCWFRFYTISFVLYFCMRVRILYRRLITFRLLANWIVFMDCIVSAIK